MAEPRFVSFLSDFGLRDEFVGVCHAVMLEIAPEARVIDVTHEIPPFDVRAGGLALVRSIQYLPAGVVLAVVDPGVGTDRRMVAVEVANGFLVGPDNGLLAPAVAMLGGPRRVVSLSNPEYQLEAPGPTFATRDVMAPAAAYLAAGVPVDELGEPVDAAGLTPGLVPLPEVRDDGTLAGEVLWVDHYGNCQLNLGPEELRERGLTPGASAEVRLRSGARRARWVETYGEAKPSELVLVTDSYGLLSLALDRRSAAAELGAGPGDGVHLALPDPAAPAAPAPPVTPVELGRPGDGA